MNALEHCAVCGHRRWFHWLTFTRFYRESPVEQFLRAVARLEKRA